ncbi:DUF1214 domain-containing protein [Pseudochelatococcus sp. G4_1912]|uniref:DUF1214 domain-containing protein n=1 Tax=Pseudochelatococcus sp. G4_1912 TaxID=3114288 RepID=UPI0039C70141
MINQFVRKSFLRIDFVRVVFVIVAAIALAAVMGLGTAYYLTRHEPPFGAVRVGPWIAWPEIGSAAIDPYARATVSRIGELSLGAGEGLAFSANRDSAGRVLNGSCTYRVRGPVPTSRAWTLTVYQADGTMPPNPTGRNGFTSHEVLRNLNGTAEIVISPEAQPGNWLMSPQRSNLMLMLRLYGTSVSTMTGAVESSGLPTIDRQSCP